jgi:hypothetical protein
MILFFDRNMGKSIPDALHLLDLPVKKHDEHFGPTTTDEEWLAKVGEEGWLAITRDERIRWNQSERRALADHRVGCFVLVGAAKLPRWDSVRIIARNWDRIQELSTAEERPFLCELHLRRPPKRVDLAPRRGT